MRHFYLPVQVALFSLLFALLSACSDDPGNSVIRDALEQELERAHLDQLFEVTEVERVNSYPDDDDHYTLDVRYTMEARRNLSEFGKAVKKDEDRDAMDRFAMVMTLASVRVEFGNFDKGETFSQERRLNLERTEDGWRIPAPEQGAMPGDAE